MSEAFIYDAIRTPRGKGKKDGALHEVKPITLLTGLMQALTERNHNFNTVHIDDVVLGCVTPVGDQGADIAKTAALAAGWDWNAAGVQINRFCASGLEAVNLAAQKVRSGWEDLAWNRCRGCRWRRTAARGRSIRIPIWMSILYRRALVPT